MRNTLSVSNSDGLRLASKNSGEFNTGLLQTRKGETPNITSKFAEKVLESLEIPDAISAKLKTILEKNPALVIRIARLQKYGHNLTYNGEASPAGLIRLESTKVAIHTIQQYTKEQFQKLGFTGVLEDQAEFPNQTPQKRGWKGYMHILTLDKVSPKQPSPEESSPAA